MTEDASTKFFRTSGKILDIIIVTIFSIMIILVATLAIQKILFKNKVPAIMGYKVLEVMSGSMSGEFETGDTILIKKVESANDLNVGDVIAFRTGDTLVAHRIVDISEENGTIKYTTKGDANNAVDENKTEFANVEGKYVKKVTSIGWLVKLIQNPVGLEALIIIPILVILRILFKEHKREKIENIRRTKRLKHEAETEI